MNKDIIQVSSFNIDTLEAKYADTCEECSDEKATPVYHLKGKYDTVDVMLCIKCLKSLRNTLNAFKL